MALVYPGEESAANAPCARFERHHHWKAYAALVIRGSCEEAGDRGRFRAHVGNVMVHRAFDAHNNCIGRSGASFLNFPIDEPLAAGFGAVADVDAIIRAHERDPLEAAALFRAQVRIEPTGENDWPDMLARHLSDHRADRLDKWAERHGLHPASLSRGFRKAYGVSPKRFRLERLASRAARRIRAGTPGFSTIAAETGFADQAHMTRVIGALFGASPRRLRAMG